MSIKYIFLFILLVKSNCFSIPLLYGKNIQLRKPNFYMLNHNNITKNYLLFPNIPDVSQNNIKNLKNITEIFILLNKDIIFLCKNNSIYHYNNDMKRDLNYYNLELEKTKIHYVSNTYIKLLNNSNFSRF